VGCFKLGIQKKKKKKKKASLRVQIPVKKKNFANLSIFSMAEGEKNGKKTMEVHGHQGREKETVKDVTAPERKKGGGRARPKIRSSKEKVMSKSEN